MKDDPLLPTPETPFSEITEAVAPQVSNDWEPNIDIGETPSAYVLVAEMPGVRSEHLNLVYEKGYLTIDAKAPPKGYHQWQRVIQDERDKGRCHRVFALPANVDVEGRREKLHQGLLTVHLPKLVGAAVKLDPPREPAVSVAQEIPVTERSEVTRFKSPEEELMTA